jgi:uncharacterized repeat protein (TIGR02543 family)
MVKDVIFKILINLEESMKNKQKRFLSVFLTIAMIASIVILPDNGFVLKAAASDPVVGFDEVILFNTLYGTPVPTALTPPAEIHGLGGTVTRNIYEVTLEIGGELRVEIDVPRDRDGVPLAVALPDDAATITLQPLNAEGNPEGSSIPMTKGCSCQLFGLSPNPKCITQSLPLEQRCNLSNAADGIIVNRADTGKGRRTFTAEDLLAGRYQIIIDRIPGTGLGVGSGQYLLFAEYFVDETDGDNSTRDGAGVQTLVPQVTVRGNISGTTDMDFYRYVFDKPGRMTVHMGPGHITAARAATRSGGHSAGLAVPHFLIPSGAIANNAASIHWFNEASPSSLFAYSAPAQANVAFNTVNVGGAHVFSLWSGSIDVEAGVYYVQVRSNTAAGGAYSMRTEFIPFEDLTEPTPQYIELNTNFVEDRTVKSFLSTRNEFDRYEIEITQAMGAGVVFIDLSRDNPATGSANNHLTTPHRPGGGGVGSISSPNLRVLCADGRAITSSVGQPTFTAAGGNAFSTFVGLEPGTYFIEVRRNGPVANARCDNTGTYTLSLEFLSAGASAPPTGNVKNEEEWDKDGKLLDCIPPGRCYICPPFRCTWCVCEGRVPRLQCTAPTPCPPTVGPWCVHGPPCEYSGSGECTFCVCKDSDTYSCHGIRSVESGKPVRGIITTIPNPYIIDGSPHPFSPYGSRPAINHRDTYEFIVTEPGVIDLSVIPTARGGLPNMGVDLITTCFQLPSCCIEHNDECNNDECDPDERVPFMRDTFNDGMADKVPLSYSTALRTAPFTSFTYLNNYFSRVFAVDPGIYQFELLQRNPVITGTSIANADRLVNNFTGIYDFRVDFTPIDVTETEPNNTRGTANVLFNQLDPASAGTVVVTAMMSLTDHDDFFRIDIDEPGRVSINVTRHSVGGLANNAVNLIWQLEQGDNASQLRTTADTQGNARLTLPHNAYMDLDITYPGSYYIQIQKVSRDIGPTGNPIYVYDTNQSGVYNISVNFTPSNCINNEPNNNREQAIAQPSATIVNGQTVTGFMSHQDRTDWFRYELPEAGNLAINLQNGTGAFAIRDVNPANGNQNNPTLNHLSIILRNEDGSENRTLQPPTGAGTTFAPPLIALEAGVYFIEVRRRVDPVNLNLPSVPTGLYHLRVSDNVSDTPTATGVLITPENTCCDLQKGQRLQLSAEVTSGDANLPPPPQGVNWRILEINKHPSTSIVTEADGRVFLVVHEQEDLTALTVRATSTFNNLVSDTHTVYLTNADSRQIILNTGANGTAIGGGWHVLGCHTTVTAVPNLDYAFDGWFENSVRIPDAEASYNFIVTNNRTLTANFRHAPGLRTITVLVGAGGGGTVSVTNSGSFEIGTQATVTATPDTAGGFSFDGWYENNIRVSTNPEFTFTVVNNRTLQARFNAPTSHSVRVGNGTTARFNYTYRSNVSITANAPPAGMQFSHWTTTSAGVEFANAQSPTTTFVMPNNPVHVTAVFSPIAEEVTGVTISPKTTQVQIGQTFQFSVSVAGVNVNQSAVLWEVSGGNETSSINGAGLLSVGAGESAETVLTVTVTSTEDATKFDTATVNLSDTAVTPTITGVTVTPNTIMLSPGMTYSANPFSASVAGTNAPQSVTWTVTSGNAGTSINSNGVLTIAANDNRQTITVTATSTVNPARSGTATVTIHQPVEEEVLTSITPPAAVGGIANGRTREELTALLPASVTIATSQRTGLSAAVVWDVAGSSYNPATTTAQTFDVNGTVTLPSGVVERNVERKVSISVTVLAAATPTAPFTITFDPNGGNWSGSTDPITRVTQANGRLAANQRPADPRRTGSNNVFQGWFLATTGGSALNLANYTFLGNITVYARWGSTSGGNQGGNQGGNNTESRRITFNLNGGSLNGSTANITRDTQDNGILAANQRPADPTRAGYTFAGWFTAATGGTQRNISTFAFSANTTLFAQWTAGNISTAGRTVMGGGFTITQAQINTISNAIPIHQLQITSTGNFTVNAGSSAARQQAVLVRFVNNRMEFVAGVRIPNNGNATLNITATGDYLVLIFKTGDVTGDGEVNTADALEVLRGVAGVTQLTGVQTFVANGNTNTATTGDALQILRFVAGLIREI